MTITFGQPEHLLEIRGVSQSITAWARDKRCPVSKKTIAKRISMGATLCGVFSPHASPNHRMGGDKTPVRLGTRPALWRVITTGNWTAPRSWVAVGVFSTAEQK